MSRTVSFRNLPDILKTHVNRFPNETCAKFVWIDMYIFFNFVCETVLWNITPRYRVSIWPLSTRFVQTVSSIERHPSFLKTYFLQETTSYSYPIQQILASRSSRSWLNWPVQHDLLLQIRLPLVSTHSSFPWSCSSIRHSHNISRPRRKLGTCVHICCSSLLTSTWMNFHVSICNQDVKPLVIHQISTFNPVSTRKLKHVYFSLFIHPLFLSCTFSSPISVTPPWIYSQFECL